MRRCAPVEEIGEEARRATPIYVPRGPSDAEQRAHEIHHMPYRSCCEYCVRGRGKGSPHLSRYEQGNGNPVVQMDYAFLHDTGDKEAKSHIPHDVRQQLWTNGCNDSPEEGTRQVC